ncbi:Bardet-Biedl syndrome 12 protein isoform X2 [Hyla sarda]|uniref:Bardet-Biedl syndrome 12 protein isoform X2 n=1 Tax=Hyla sarda TaxID=327740 RepID=UPI0024C338FD|nr:Bardet-Biedl syndrome 12 protein isoform X2 [Hyla sarda]
MDAEWLRTCANDLICRPCDQTRSEAMVSAVKLRDHLELIELFNISTSVKTLLGPRKSYKFIYNEDTQESTLTCSSFRLLESLELSSAAGQIFNETIQAHHKEYKTGTTTLFFLVGVWSKAVLECLHHGVPISLIVSGMLEGLNSCIESVKELYIPIDNIATIKQNTRHRTLVADERNGHVSHNENHCFSSSRGGNIGPDTCPGHIANTVKHIDVTPPGKGNLNSKSCQMSKLSHSRHFSISKISSFQNPSQPSSHSLEDLTKSLSHGNWEVMELVEKAATLLSENSHETSLTKDVFQASCLNICFVKGVSEVNSSAAFGYVTLVRPEYVTVVKNFEGKPLKVLLLDGELTENYRHIGFNKATNLKLVSEIADHERSAEDLWISTACQKIVQASINLILVRGDACPQLIMQCLQRNILIITHVRSNVLQAFSECTGAEPVAYLTEMSPHSIGCEVYATLCPQWSSQSSQTAAISLHAHKINLATVVLNCRLMPKVQVMEDQFWACSYKLHNAFFDRKVFPGGGAVELFCLHHLQKLETMLESGSPSHSGSQSCMSSWLSSSAIHYKSSVYKCLAKGWIKYLSTLLFNVCQFSSELEAMTFIQNELQNVGTYSSPSLYMFNEYSRNVLFIDDSGLPIEHRQVPVYDNVIPKVEAWRSALHLVLTVLQSDAEIITRSIKQKDSLGGDYVFL